MNAPVIASVALASAVGAGLVGYGAYKAVKRNAHVPLVLQPNAPERATTPSSVGLQTPRCPNVMLARGFDNPGNMCYMNTVLFLLLVVFRAFTNEYMYGQDDTLPKLKLIDAMQDEQNRMMDLMQGIPQQNMYCTTVMHAINAATGTSFQNQQGDPPEVLQALFQLFELTHMIVFQDKQLLPWMEVENAIPSFNDIQREAPLVVVQLGRTNEDGIKNMERIRLSQTIGNKTLFAVIVHLGEEATSGHYAAFFRYPNTDCRYMWYYYDDMQSPHIRLMGEYSDLAYVHPYYNPASNGVLFFYWDGRYGDPMNVSLDSL